MEIPKPKPRPNKFSEDTLKTSAQIKELTEAMKDTKNLVEAPVKHIPAPDGTKFDHELFLKNLEQIGDEVFTDEVAREFIIPKEGGLKKMPYVPKEHLTQTPFRDNPALQELRKNMEPSKPPVKRNPRRKPATKTQEKK